MKSASFGKLLLLADGDMPTTRLLVSVLELAYGEVDVRLLDAVFRTDVAGAQVVLSPVCRPSHAWLPRYYAPRGLK